MINRSINPNAPINHDCPMLLTVDDLSSSFGLSPKTIRNWIALRKIPFVMVGRRAMFRSESIDRWIKDREVKEFL